MRLLTILDYSLIIVSKMKFALRKLLRYLSFSFKYVSMEILNRLKEIDLETVSTDEINKVLNQVGALPIMKTEYSDGKLFFRAVRNSDADSDFTTVSRLSFCPPEYNKNLLRASTPDNTMFYGSVVKDNPTDEEYNYARITACCETSELLRDNEIPDGERVLTIGTWRVKGKLQVGTIFDPNKKYEIEYLENIKNAYIDFLEHFPDLKEKGLAYLAYLANEYSKDVKNGENYKYKISALFSKIAADKSDGILYPSVRAAGIGLCLAIKPDAMENLELVMVHKCLLKKENGVVRITFLKVCEVEEGAENFELLDVSEYKRRREESKK